MLTVDKMQAIFERGKKPYWVLYKGAGRGVQIGTNCLDGDEKPTIETAWDELEFLLGNYADGVYTLECRSHPKASRGNDQHTFMIGTAEDKPARVAGNGGNVQHPAVGFFHGLDAKYFMDQISGSNNTVQALQIDNLKKEMEIQNLKRELKEKRDQPTPADRIFGLLEKNPTIIEKVLGGGAPAAVGLLKAERPIPEPLDIDADENEEDEYPYEAGKIDLNSLFEAAARIQKALPGQHVNDVLDGLANWIEDNPETATQYLKLMSP